MVIAYAVVDNNDGGNGGCKDDVMTVWWRYNCADDKEVVAVMSVELGIM